LRLQIQIPMGTEFTKDAPFSIEVKADNPKVVTFKDKDITMPAEKLEIPFTASPGKATVTINMTIYYCSGNQGQCFFKDARLKIPVNVTDKGPMTLSAIYQIMH
jgi:hypothetical protein